MSKKLQMQRRIKSEPKRPKQPKDGKPKYKYIKPDHEDPNRKKINQYTCRTCAGVITTVDRDYGTTTVMLNCRATEGCTGTMDSSYYQVEQALTPQYEWFRPAKLPRDSGMRWHLQMGGLAIRPIVKKL